MTDRPPITETRIDETSAQPTVAIRVQEPMAALAAAFDRNLPLLASTIEAHGGAIAGPPFGRYHAFGPDHVDVEIGFPVVAPPDGLPTLESVPAGEVGTSELPAGPVARTVHRGPYESLPTTYESLQGWIEQQAGYDQGLGPWESYVDDPGAVAESELRTEIWWPLVVA